MTSPPKRRWLRFSLRTLLVLVVLLALPLGWIAKERRQSAIELQVAEQLRLNGFDQELHTGGPYDTWEIFRQGNQQGRWRDLAKQVLGQRVLFIGSETAENIALLSRLDSLVVLGLNNTNTRDITPLANHKNLQLLFLDNTQVTDLTALFGLTHLQELHVHGTPVSDEQVSALQQALPNCKIER